MLAPAYKAELPKAQHRKMEPGQLAICLSQRDTVPSPGHQGSLSLGAGDRSRESCRERKQERDPCEAIMETDEHMRWGNHPRSGKDSVTGKPEITAGTHTEPGITPVLTNQTGKCPNS